MKNFISAEEQRRAQLESAASTHTTPAVLDSMRLPESTVMRRRKASSSYLYKYQENVNFIVFQRIDFVALLSIFLSYCGFSSGRSLQGGSSEALKAKKYLLTTTERHFWSLGLVPDSDFWLSGTRYI